MDKWTNFNIKPHLNSSNGVFVANPCQAVMSDEEDEEIMERIVTSVRACASISTSALQDGVIAEMVELVEMCSIECDECKEIRSSILSKLEGSE